MVYDKLTKKSLSSTKVVLYLSIIPVSFFVFFIAKIWDRLDKTTKIFPLFIILPLLFIIFISAKSIGVYKKNQKNACELRKKISSEKEIICEGPVVISNRRTFETYGNFPCDWMFLTKDSLEFCALSKKCTMPSSIPLDEITEVQKKGKIRLELTIITNTNTYKIFVAESCTEWYNSILSAINVPDKPITENAPKSQTSAAPINQKKEPPKASSTDSFSSDFSTFG